MRTEVFNSANGDRPDFADVAVLIIDDAPSHEVGQLLEEEVMRIKERNITVVGVGVTERVSVSFATYSRGHNVTEAPVCMVVGSCRSQENRVVDYGVTGS